MSQPEDDEGGNRVGATIGGAIVVLVVVGLGYWLVEELAENARYAKCAAMRQRNCDKIDYRERPPQQ
jgi:hypothetical protein